MQDDKPTPEPAPEPVTDPEPDLPNPLAYQTRNGKPGDFNIKLGQPEDYNTKQED
jgi:hypothetical protein